MRAATRFVIALGVATLTGCSLFGAIFVEPGATVTLIAASSNQVTYEYTHSYDSELPFAGRAVEQQCSRYGRHAELANIVRENLDRSLVTFRCQ